MKTRITELLGIKYPIICGGMAWVGTGDLPAAVSNAGGAGIIGSGSMPVEALVAQVQKTRSQTDKPFGINLQRGVPHADELLKCVAELKPAFVTIGGGDPRPCIEPLKKAGVKVIPVVPSLKLAKRLEQLGVDAIVTEGMEAGGHIGYQTTMALMGIVLPEIKKIPVIVGGGIGDGKAMAAALIMGASAVQVGTAFLLTNECPAHQNAKQMMIEADDQSSIVTGHTRGDGVRGLKNKFSQEYLKMELAGVSDEELMKFGTGRTKLGHIDGDIENGSVVPGLIIARFNKVVPVKELVDGFMKDCEESLKNAPSLLN